MKPLHDHRMLVVVGKGGVGRTSASVALAMHAARQGKRVVLTEFNRQGEVARIFGLGKPSYTQRELPGGSRTFSLAHDWAVVDFAARKLRMRTLGKLVFENKLMSSFLESIPGLPDLLQLGKVEDMLYDPLPSDPPVDLVILDAPATGHGLTLLQSPETMAEISKVGPFFELAERIRKFLASDDVATVLVTLPEQLPVQESLELVDQLQAIGQPPARILINQMQDGTMGRAWPMLRERLQDDDAGKALQALGDSHERRIARQTSATELLDQGLKERTFEPEISELPWIPGGQLELADYQTLANALEVSHG